MNTKPDSAYLKIYLLKEPIIFKLKVNGELLEAQIVSIMYEYVFEDEFDDDLMPDLIKWFTIKFSNGYAENYYIDTDEVFTENGQDRYTAALQEEICWGLECWDEDRPAYTLTWPVNDIETTIWIYKVGDENYSVIYNDDYRFSVKLENDQWKAHSIRQVDPTPIDQALAETVFSMVKYYRSHPPEFVKKSNPYVRPKKPRSMCGFEEGHILALPITFIITVNGELLNARIESVRYEYPGYEEDHPDTWVDITWFNIKFSNGYEDEYTVEPGEVHSNKGQDKYTDALQEEICMALLFWYETKEIYTLGWPIDGIETNIWVYRVNCFSEVEYFVYFNGDYRFTIKFEDDQWTPISHRIKDPEIIDEALAKKVISMLKHYQKKAL